MVDQDEEEAPLVSSSLETAEPSENSSLYISSIIGFHSRTRALMNQHDIWLIVTAGCQLRC